MGRYAEPRTLQVFRLVRAAGDTGVLVKELAQAMPEHRPSALSKSLSNLLQAGRVRNVRNGNLCKWFALERAEPEARSEFAGQIAENKRMWRARHADRVNPITFFGERLPAPRSPSVWAYARHFQEQRA